MPCFRTGVGANGAVTWLGSPSTGFENLNIVTGAYLFPPDFPTQTWEPGMAVVDFLIVRPDEVAAGLNVNVDPAVLVLSGVDVAAAGTGVASVTVDAATLTLTGLTPVAAGSGVVAVLADPATLVLAGVDVAAAGTGTAVQSVDSALLVLVGVDVEAATAGQPEPEMVPVVVQLRAAVAASVLDAANSTATLEAADDTAELDAATHTATLRKV